MDSPRHDGFSYRALSLLAASDRIQHSNEHILPLLEEGKTVISDRYFYSCIANLRARGYVNDNWIYEIATYVPKPDLSIFLDVNVKTALRRVRSRKSERDKYIDIPLQYRLRKEYIKICDECGGVLINSEGPPEETFEKVMAEVDFILETKICERQCTRGEVLWTLQK